MGFEEYKKIYEEALKKYEGDPGLLNRMLTSGGEVGQYMSRGNIDKCLEGARRRNRPTSCGRLDEDGVEWILPDVLKVHEDEICRWMADVTAEDHLFVDYDGLLGGGYICFPDGTVRMATRITFLFRRPFSLNEFGFSFDGLSCVYNPDKLGPIVDKNRKGL